MGGLVHDPARVDSRGGDDSKRSPVTGSEVESYLRIGVTKMFADPHLLLVLAQ